MIRTAQDDAYVTTTNHLRFTVSRPAAVYLAFDRDAPRPPAWLAGWEDTGLQILSDYAGGFRVYRKSFGVGQVILGGNEGSYTGAVSSYFVLAAPLVALRMSIRGRVQSLSNGPTRQRIPLQRSVFPQHRHESAGKFARGGETEDRCAVFCMVLDSLRMSKTTKPD